MCDLRFARKVAAMRCHVMLHHGHFHIDSALLRLEIHNDKSVGDRETALLLALTHA